MRKITQYIIEKLKVKKTEARQKIVATSPAHLIELISDEIKKYGVHCSLNHIDVSEITNFTCIFALNATRKFDGDISEWDVSNANEMVAMFKDSSFTGNYGDISEWDVSNVFNFYEMFAGSDYDGDISDWNLSKAKHFSSMFYKANFTGKNGDINKWDVSNVRNMNNMFQDSKLELVLNDWTPDKMKPGDCISMFNGSPVARKKPKWYQIKQSSVF